MKFLFWLMNFKILSGEISEANFYGDSRKIARQDPSWKWRKQEPGALRYSRRTRTSGNSSDDNKNSLNKNFNRIYIFGSKTDFWEFSNFFNRLYNVINSCLRHYILFKYIINCGFQLPKILSSNMSWLDYIIQFSACQEKKIIMMSLLMPIFKNGVTLNDFVISN